MSRLSLFALAFGALLFTGCDAIFGEGNDDDLFGEFRADVFVDGDRESAQDEDDETDAGRLKGEAIYTIIETERGREFVLGLFVGDLFDSQYDEYQFISFRREGGLPGIGGYPITEDPQRFGVTSTYANVLDANESRLDRDADERARGPILYGIDGTLVITEVDPIGVVSGRFNFDARGITVERSGDSVFGDANGEFEARYERPELMLGRGLDL